MIEVSFSSSFKRAFKKSIKNNQKLEQKFWKKAELFIKNPYDNRLRTHKLTGKLADLWSFSIEYDCRVIFYFSTPSKAVFIDIGTHNDVY
jgi:addiction module RelE/StbE family toxin